MHKRGKIWKGSVIIAVSIMMRTRCITCNNDSKPVYISLYWYIYTLGSSSVATYEQVVIHYGTTGFCPAHLWLGASLRVRYIALSSLERAVIIRVSLLLIRQLWLNQASVHLCYSVSPEAEEALAAVFLGQDQRLLLTRSVDWDKKVRNK